MFRLIRQVFLINCNVSGKNILRAKKIIVGILAHLLVSMESI